MGGTGPIRRLCHRSPIFAAIMPFYVVELYVTSNYCLDSGAGCCSWLFKMSGSACSLFSSELICRCAFFISLVSALSDAVLLVKQ
jgi:hypothetical protein